MKACLTKPRLRWGIFIACLLPQLSPAFEQGTFFIVDITEDPAAAVAGRVRIEPSVFAISEASSSYSSLLETERSEFEIDYTKLGGSGETSGSFSDEFIIEGFSTPSDSSASESNLEFDLETNSSGSAFGF